MNKVSVIILNWNRKKDVSKTISFVKRQTVKPMEIIVVDNASIDGSVEYIHKIHKNVHILSLPKNIALAGFNEGMKIAKGNYFLLLASDAIPKSNVIEKHLSKFRNLPKLGVSSASTFEYKTGKYIGGNRAVSGDNKSGFSVTYFDGNGICLKRGVFQKTGGYDPKYFICLEELEWAVRILTAGFDIKCFTDIVVYNSRSGVGNQRSKYGYFYARNWVWFYVKYLPVREIFGFLRLHMNSYKVKTGSKGTMNKIDVFKGVFVGIVTSINMLVNRRVLGKQVVDRLKLDLFPNKSHLYTI
jgi:GT2 family glycosyltransferase